MERRVSTSVLYHGSIWLHKHGVGCMRHELRRFVRDDSRRRAPSQSTVVWPCDGTTGSQYLKADKSVGGVCSAWIIKIQW
jgi:hypothetical protein